MSHFAPPTFLKSSTHNYHYRHWWIQGGGQPGHDPPKPRQGTIMSFAPPPKLPKSCFLSKVNLCPSQKTVGSIRGVFSFGGTLGWDPAPSCPPPPSKTGGWIRQCLPYRRMYSRLQWWGCVSLLAWLTNDRSY